MIRDPEIERQHAEEIAQWILDNGTVSDSNELAVLARQFLRAIERERGRRSTGRSTNDLASTMGA
jgi:hypothetical protein